MACSDCNGLHIRRACSMRDTVAPRRGPDPGRFFDHIASMLRPATSDSTLSECVDEPLSLDGSFSICLLVDFGLSWLLEVCLANREAAKAGGALKGPLFPCRTHH